MYQAADEATQPQCLSLYANVQSVFNAYQVDDDDSDDDKNRRPDRIHGIFARILVYCMKNNTYQNNVTRFPPLARHEKIITYFFIFSVSGLR